MPNYVKIGEIIIDGAEKLAASPAANRLTDQAAQLIGLRGAKALSEAQKGAVGFLDTFGLHADDASRLAISGDTITGASIKIGKLEQPWFESVKLVSPSPAVRTDAPEVVDRFPRLLEEYRGSVWLQNETSGLARKASSIELDQFFARDWSPLKTSFTAGNSTEAILPNRIYLSGVGKHLQISTEKEPLYYAFSSPKLTVENTGVRDIISALKQAPEGAEARLAGGVENKSRILDQADIDKLVSGDWSPLRTPVDYERYIVGHPPILPSRLSVSGMNGRFYYSEYVNSISYGHRWAKSLFDLVSRGDFIESKQLNLLAQGVDAVMPLRLSTLDTSVSVTLNPDAIARIGAGASPGEVAIQSLVLENANMAKTVDQYAWAAAVSEKNARAAREATDRMIYEHTMANARIR